MARAYGMIATAIAIPSITPPEVEKAYAAFEAVEEKHAEAQSVIHRAKALLDEATCVTVPRCLDQLLADLRFGHS